MKKLFMFLSKILPINKYTLLIINPIYLIESNNKNKLLDYYKTTKESYYIVNVLNFEKFIQKFFSFFGTKYEDKNIDFAYELIKTRNTELLSDYVRSFKSLIEYDRYTHTTLSKLYSWYNIYDMRFFMKDNYEYIINDLKNSEKYRDYNNTYILPQYIIKDIFNNQHNILLFYIILAYDKFNIYDIHEIKRTEYYASFAWMFIEHHNMMTFSPEEHFDKYHMFLLMDYRYFTNSIKNNEWPANSEYATYFSHNFYPEYTELYKNKISINYKKYLSENEQNDESLFKVNMYIKKIIEMINKN